MHVFLDNHSLICSLTYKKVGSIQHGVLRCSWYYIVYEIVLAGRTDGRKRQFVRCCRVGRVNSISSVVLLEQMIVNRPRQRNTFEFTLTLVIILLICIDL